MKHNGSEITQNNIDLWKASVQNYKEVYKGMYQSYPSEFLIESHCKIYNIPWPLPRLDKEFDFLE